MPLAEVRSAFESFDLVTEPKEHQWKCLLIGVSKKTWLFALDMGLGKTKLALDIQAVLTQLEGKRYRMLVTCPPIVLSAWKIEVAKHSKATATFIEGDPNDKIDALLNSDTDIVVASHVWLTKYLNGLKAGDVRAHRKRFAEFDILIVDEAHKLMNPRAVGFKMYKKFLLGIPRRYLLTGTPIANTYLGVWSLYYLLDKGETFGTSNLAFLETWFDVFLVQERFPKYTIRAEVKQDFQDRFWVKCIRYVETDCSDLPEKRYTRIPLRMREDQYAEYKRTLDKEEDLDRAIHSLMRITGGVQTKGSVKIDALTDILTELCISRSEQLIIWHWLVAEGELIEDLCEKLQIPYGSVRGSTTRKQLTDHLFGWREGKVKVLIANPLSLGTGVTLTEASTCIFYSNNRSLIDRKQSEKRIHRHGQRNLCTYLDLVCENTIDEVILGGLKKAGDGFDDMLEVQVSLAQLRNAFK